MLAELFEWHYTPKHGSWLDMAEIEIGIMSRQALGKPLADLESFEEQVRALDHKAECRTYKNKLAVQDTKCTNQISQTESGYTLITGRMQY